MSASQRSSFFFAALLLSLSSVLSRILGYFRDVVIAAKLGASAETDAYYAAFGLPDLLLYFLAGGALSIAFVPIFQRLKSQQGDEAAWRLFGNIASVGGVVFGVVLALAWWKAEALMSLLVPRFSPEQLALTASLTRIILPAPLFFFLGGLLSATEVAEGRFRSTALAPLLYNVCIIAGGLLLEPFLGVAGFSWGALAGAILGPFATNLAFAWRHIRLRPSLSLRAPSLRKYLWVALPLMVGVSLTTVDEWIGRFFASGMTEGSISWLNNARRLMMVPIAIVGQAIGQAALPFLSRLVTEERIDDFHSELSRTLRGTTLIAAAAALGTAAVAPAIVPLVYGHGAYTATDVARSTELLTVLAIAIPAWCVQAVALRSFYARSETWVPMLATTVVTLGAIPVYSVLASRMDIAGIALATGIMMAAQLLAIVTIYGALHRHWMLLDILGASLRGGLAALPGSALAYLLIVELAPGQRASLNALFVFGVGAAVFGALTLPLLLLFGGDDAAALRQRVRRVSRRLITGA